MMKSKLLDSIIYLVILAGIAILAYPFVSSFINSFTQGRHYTEYQELVGGLTSEEKDAVLTEAKDYNASLSTQNDRFFPSEAQHARYSNTLLVNPAKIIAKIDIPSIEVSLPVYHGTSDGVLQVAVGHMEGTSLPVGGQGTHAVLTGHTGLPSATLFTRLSQVAVGDRFSIHVLDEDLYYEVDQIHVVTPDDVTDLAIDPNQDYVTLMTCTPYGVNTHRLLVRGHRVEAEPENFTADNMIEIRYVLLALGALFILVLVLFYLSVRKKKKKE